MSPDPYERVSSLMSTPAITVEPQATLREVAVVLDEANIGAVVVLAPSRPMAVISERDIVRALADGAYPDAIWAADVVTEEPWYVTPSHPVPRLAEEMLAAGVRHMPVATRTRLPEWSGARDALRSLTESVLARLSTDAHRAAIDLERELAYPGG